MTYDDTYSSERLILGAIVLIVRVILDGALQRGKIVSKCDISYLLIDLANAATDEPLQEQLDGVNRKRLPERH